MSNFSKFFGGTMGIVVALLLGSCCVISVPVACVVVPMLAVPAVDAAKKAQEKNQAKEQAKEEEKNDEI